MKITVKRVYDEALPSDGWRVLVDRIWPRGISREKLKHDVWLSAIAPSAELRKWFGHDPARWTEFRARYYAELRNNRDVVSQLLEPAHDRLTLVYAAKDVQFNNAVALKSYLERQLKSSSRKRKRKPVAR
jgi:uncharacterized protein YeaO (DUF488 family)